MKQQQSCQKTSRLLRAGQEIALPRRAGMLPVGNAAHAISKKGKGVRVVRFQRSN